MRHWNECCFLAETQFLEFFSAFETCLHLCHPHWHDKNNGCEWVPQPWTYDKSLPHTFIANQCRWHHFLTQCHCRSIGIKPCFLTVTANQWRWHHHLHLPIIPSAGQWQILAWDDVRTSQWKSVMADAGLCDLCEENRNKCGAVADRQRKGAKIKTLKKELPGKNFALQRHKEVSQRLGKCTVIFQIFSLGRPWPKKLRRQHKSPTTCFPFLSF